MPTICQFAKTYFKTKNTPPKNNLDLSNQLARNPTDILTPPSE